MGTMPPRRLPVIADIHALIAVKDLARAKSRLADHFAPHDRERLVLAMFRDTLAATRDVPQIASVTVVTPDASVSETAVDCGAAVYPEPPLDSADKQSTEQLNDALRAAGAHLRATKGAVDIVVLQADLPALLPAELAEAIEAAPIGRRSIVVDHRGIGTCALLLRDPTAALDPLFGKSSAQRHTAAGALALPGRWPGLRLDVDTVEDLALAQQLGLGPATAKLVTEIGWDPGSRDQSSH